MKQEVTARYAIPCSFGFNDMIGPDDEFFFLTFNTLDEKTAYTLARCICGDYADKALVIISEEGEIFHL